MNIIEAAKAAGILPERDETFGRVYEVEEQQLERFAQIIRNQALEYAAKVCDGLPAPESCSQVERSLWDVATMAAGAMKKDQQ